MQNIIDRCGGYESAVEAIMSLARAIWTTAVEDDLARYVPGQHPYYWIIATEDLKKGLAAQSVSIERTSFLDDLLYFLREAQLSATADDRSERFTRSAFHPLALARELLKQARPDYELRYFIYKNIRKRWSRILSSTGAHEFQLLCDSLNAAIRLRWGDDPNIGPRFDAHNSDVLELWRSLRDTYHIAENHRNPSPSQNWAYKDIMRVLSLARTTGEDDLDWSRAIHAFTESCLTLNYIQAHDKKPGWVVVRTRTVDSAFLLSNLFGLKTGVRGFDELFGGGGLILPDDEASEKSRSISGRAVLTMGRFGTGKSLLSLQVATDIARKGGLAYVMTVEQTPEEYLYALGSVCALPPRELVALGCDSASARSILQKEPDGRGALIILNPLKESFQDFAVTLQKDLELIRRYPLRLLIVDAVNAISRQSVSGSKLRAETFDLLQAAKYTGTNIWLVIEETPIYSDKLLHYQNISDTVIRLTTEPVAGYSQRYFEITKSRFQREQRGRHPFSISPGMGISIFPSAAAVSARIQPRSMRPPDTPIQFGLPALDEILGKDALCAGDVVVLQGPPGSLKTRLGLLFLLGTDQPVGGFAKSKKTESVVLLTRGSTPAIKPPTPTKDRVSMTKRFPGMQKTIHDIRVCPVGRGYVKPGYILGRIEEELLDAHLKGHFVDRVMVDSISHWDSSCPFIQEEKTFGDTLVDLLRKHQVTSVFICDDNSSVTGSALQQSVIDSADCLIHFSRVEYGGSYHVRLRILKTRGMRHRREVFDLSVDDQGIDIKKNSSLLRVSADGSIEPLKITLFLHNATDVQRRQNDSLLNAMRSVVSPHVEVNSSVSDTGDLVRAWSLGNSSAIDELQIVQVDEFQLPRTVRRRSGSLPVHLFGAGEWTLEWDDLIPRLMKRVQFKQGSFIGLPIYQNIGLLVRSSSTYSESTGSSILSDLSWEDLSDECENWEAQHPDVGSTFFGFGSGVPETYNCLFFEMLLSKVSPTLASGAIRLDEWLASERAIEVSKLYRRLCRRAYLRRRERLRSGDGRRRPAIQNAIVWRLWYSELNSILSSVDPEVRNNIQVSALPRQVSVAGEWYLTIPAYSAACDVGLEIIKLLTTHDAELERLRSGMGLPTRSGFYRLRANKRDFVSPYFTMSLEVLERVVTNAFERSSVANYANLSGILSSHLQAILEIPPAAEATIEAAISAIFDNLLYQMRFVQP